MADGVEVGEGAVMAKGWRMDEVVGIAPVNHRTVVKVTGDPEQLQQLVDFLVCECGGERKADENGAVFTCEDCGSERRLPLLEDHGS